MLPRHGDVVKAAEGQRRAGDQGRVGLGRRQDQPDHRHDEEQREHRKERYPGSPHNVASHSSVLKSPVRVMMITAATTPIRSRSTAMAAAALKSPYWNANW